MIPDIKIISEHNNENFLLVLNESILLLDKKDSVIIPLKFANINWKIILKFIYDDSLEPLQGNLSFDHTNVIYTMNKWESDTYVETTNPVQFNARDEKGKTTNEFFMKIRSSAPINFNFRQVFVSIWKKQ